MLAKAAESELAFAFVASATTVLADVVELVVGAVVAKVQQWG